MNLKYLYKDIICLLSTLLINILNIDFFTSGCTSKPTDYIGNNPGYAAKKLNIIQFHLENMRDMLIPYAVSIFIISLENSKYLKIS